MIACLHPGSASAVSLGELEVRSAVGQPFSGVASARINAGERLDAACFKVLPNSGDALSRPADIRVTAPTTSTPGTYPVEIRSLQPLYEPMYEIRLQFKCAGTATLSRDYVVMLNLPMAAPQSRPLVETAPPAAAAPVTVPAATRAASPRPAATRSADPGRLAASREAIPAASTYRVRSGDTLSTIANRIDGRLPGTTGEVAELLFAANPDAFIRNNPNLIKLGAVLQIPDTAVLTGRAAPESAPTAPAATAIDYSQATVAPAAPQPARPEPTAEIPAATTTQPITTLPVDVTSTDGMALDAATPFAAAAPAVPDTSETADIAGADWQQAGAWVPDTGFENAEVIPGEPLTTAEAGDPFAPVAEEPAAATPAPASKTAPAGGVHPLIAVGSGILIGLLLALLMLGRPWLSALLAGRARRKAAFATATASVAGAGLPIDAAAAETTPAMIPDAAEAAARETAPADLTSVRYKQGGIDVEFSEHDSDDVDFNLSDVLTDTGADTAPGRAPRVSLRGKDDTFSDFDDMLDGLQGSAMPAAGPHDQPVAGGKSPLLEGTGTMRSLFETTDDNAPTEELQQDDENVTAEMHSGSESATVELPGMETADIDPDDLASLSRKLSAAGDENISATLTQALELLERDYEEELSASQVLDRARVREALSRKD